MACIMPLPGTAGGETVMKTEKRQSSEPVPKNAHTKCRAARTLGRVAPQLSLTKHHHNSPSRHSADKGKVKSRGGVFGNRRIITLPSGVEIKPSCVRMKSGPFQKTQPNFSYNMGFDGDKPPSSKS